MPSSDLFNDLKISYASPDKAFVQGIFGLAARDLLGGSGFNFAVGINNVNQVTADEG